MAEEAVVQAGERDETAARQTMRTRAVVTVQMNDRYVRVDDQYVEISSNE